MCCGPDVGAFTITFGENTAGPWPRPTAKRLCELLLVSPGRRIGREAACEALFPNLSPDAASNALSKALTLARSALSRLGAPATELLEADRTNIWVGSNCKLEVDFGPTKRPCARRCTWSLAPPGRGPR